MREHLRIVIAIATAGRPVVLLETLREMRAQVRRPDAIFVCPADEADVDQDAVADLDLPVRYCRGPRGASSQRNAILREVGECDVVLFLDDDFVMASDYLAELERLFLDQPDVVVTTGRLLADDVYGPGLGHNEAVAMLSFTAPPRDEASTTDVFCGYGCNMAVRWSRLAAEGIAFDERLPLYSWAEDVDFSRQAAPFGRIVKSVRLRGVHRAVKSGRTKGTRFGYSQVANQLYLARKGTITARLALIYGGRNVLANLYRSVRPEPFIDRRGRLFGNLLGLIDIARARSRPERILEL